MFSSSDFTPSVFEGKGEIELRGKKISYHTVSEDNVIYDNEGKAIASIFSFSYFSVSMAAPEHHPAWSIQDSLVRKG